MKLSNLIIPTAAAALLTAAVVTAAQAPAAEAVDYPSPMNLKVFPKETTGREIHAVMERWSAGIGADCDSCHAADPNIIGPDGRPRLDFASDAKPMKVAARTMYAMTEKINVDYIAKIDGSGAPVTCGTCHRGHLGPEPFVTAPKNMPAFSLSSHPPDEK